MHAPVHFEKNIKKAVVGVRLIVSSRRFTCRTNAQITDCVGMHSCAKIAFNSGIFDSYDNYIYMNSN